MLRILIDEGLPWQAADGLAALGLFARALTHPDFDELKRGGDDEDNIVWCRENEAILVTNDRGKADRTIRGLLIQERVHAIFVHGDLRTQPPHCLARALLNAEAPVEDLIGRNKLISHRLKPTGRLEKRG